MNWLKKDTTLLFIIILIIGAILRFYNLNWGAPFYFHPDERNIASSVSQLILPTQMNPNFFAYGSLPIYVFFFTGVLTNFISSCLVEFSSCLSTDTLGKVGNVSFEQAIIISRVYSAIFAVLLIPLLFSISKKLYGNKAGILTAALATFSVGFIQFAHFGTTEMWLAFFSTLFFLLCLKTLERQSKSQFLLLALVGGALLSAKISTVLLLFLPLPTLFFYYQKQTNSLVRSLLKTLGSFIVFLSITIFFYFLTNPYVIFDTASFLGSMFYESAVAAGTLPVFYTQEFFDTIPIIFQLRFVYPFLLNPVMLLLFIPLFIIWIVSVLTKRNKADILLLLFFLTLFLSQAILFVKWTRYMVPTLPFIYLIITGGGLVLVRKFQLLRRRAVVYLGGSLLIVLCSIYAFSYLITTFGATDTRFTAAAFAEVKLPASQNYLSEVYDLGITPLNPMLPATTLFNFYELDNDSPEATPKKLQELVDSTQYIILPSQRVLKTRLLQAERFPRGNAFYAGLYTGDGYRKIYETPCDIFCRITYMGDPIFSYEETANVFDRPTIMIYQKVN